MNAFAEQPELLMPLDAALEQLRRSERGRRAIAALAYTYCLGASGLDAENQRAFLSVLQLGMFGESYALYSKITPEIDQVKFEWAKLHG